MADIGVAEFLPPILAGAALLFVLNRVAKGEPRDPTKPYSRELLARNAANHWSDVVVQEHFVAGPEGDPPIEVSRVRTDPNGQLVLPYDTGHAFSRGFHPELTLEENQKPLTLARINAHRTRVANTRPGYMGGREVHRTRREVIQKGH